MKRLTHNTFDSDEAKTEGINVQNWKLPCNGTDIRVNIWDFGGQEIMHATHQFFLTQRSLYLLVLDNRQSEGQNRVEHWLKLIQAFGSQSPIIIVGNQNDVHALDLDKRSLREKYPTLRAILATSCTTGEGLEKLRQEIAKQIDQIPHIKDEFQTSHFNLKSQLEAMETDFISYEKYQDLCISEGIETEKEQKRLIEFLHDLGIVLNFKNDARLNLNLNETNVLNPEWVTTGTYRLINNNALMTRDKGILKRNQLATILNDAKRYPTNKHTFLLNLLQKIELCFPLDDTATRYLLPDLLDRETPYTGDWQGAMQFEYHYPVLPSSIISRFIVRTHKLSPNATRWRTGVILERNGATAIVSADNEDRTITIKVKGTQPRTLLEIIRTTLDNIHDTFSFEPEEFIALPDNPKVIVNYFDLLAYEAKGILTMPIRNGLSRSLKEYNVRELLNGIEDFESRTHRTDRLTRREQNQEHLDRKREELRSKPKQLRNAWRSGLPYFLFLVGIGIVVAIISHFVPLGTLVIIVLSMILGAVVIGAFQLTQDKRISGDNAVDLISSAIEPFKNIFGDTQKSIEESKPETQKDKE